MVDTDGEGHGFNAQPNKKKGFKALKLVITAFSLIMYHRVLTGEFVKCVQLG